MYFHRAVDVFRLWMNPVLWMSHWIIHSTNRLIKTLIKDGHLFRSQMNQHFWMNWFWTNGRCVQNCILYGKYCIWFETCFTSLPFTTCKVFIGYAQQNLNRSNKLFRYFLLIVLWILWIWTQLTYYITWK